MSLKGKVALVTGSGKNLEAGKTSPASTIETTRRADRDQERVKQLAKEGVNLALHYNSSKSKEQTLSFYSEITKQYPSLNVSVHAGDLGTAAAVERLFSEVLAEHNRIDIVVNTAGLVLQKPITNIPEAEYDKLFAYAVFVDEQRSRSVDQLDAELARRQSS